ncbi:helix-turn-helix domain-containing protein [Haloferax sulfurifontis]|uniref:HTH arsR-type domain-containing protein n=2 Tax=Haloferax sulfurifontis TaxID=255616 RepID=M0IKM2_9EURY|nr:helix-turn-helix domain-containing protein [Haloferax sulfurifontis]ELZ96572.1 hypothetical protein C441_04369 [Haloferax sulfurifontis ATCC BAA-897]GGC72746.1 hypothetical protein GCM10007209_38420 [Haloferax sulfurifontis]
MPEHTHGEAIDEVSGTRWEDLLGDGSKPAILLGMLARRHEDLNKTDIAKAADVTRMTVDRNLGDLLDLGVIKPTRKAGNAQMYQFDADSHVGAALLELDRALMLTAVDDEQRE